MTDTADYAKIKDDISKLKDDLSGLIKQLQNDGLEDFKSSVDLHKIDDLVKQNPKESMAIAFAAGAVLALLLGRK